MAIKINFAGVSILKPGGYSILDTSLLTQSPLGASGIVGIIGEADGGEPRVLDILSQSQIQEAKKRYVSGPIAKVLDLLAQPSNDPRIPNGSSKIIVFKTNNSVQASLDLNNDQASPAAIISLTSRNWGVDENNINVLVSAGNTADAQAILTGTNASPFTLAGSDTLIVKFGGNTYTYTSSLGAGSKTASQIASDISNNGNWAPSRPVDAAAVTVGSNLVVQLSLLSSLGNAAKLEYGVFNVDAASTEDTILGLSNSPVRGVKGSRVVSINKGNVTDTSLSLGDVAILSILYTGAGTACALSIQDVAGVKTLTTVATGASSDNLTIAIKNITVSQLLNQIAANANYTVSSSFFNKSAVLAGDVLDYYSGIDIKSLAALLYGVVEAANDFVNSSALVSSVVDSNVVGQLVTVSPRKYLSGGALGASSNTDFQNGFDALKSVRVNTVVPLISKDAVGDSTYTIDSVNSQADSHCAFMSSTLGKSERNCYVSKHGTKTAVINAAKDINSRHTSLVAQKPTELNEFGTLEEMEEYALACICAGMQAGAEVGEPITFKFIRAVALTQDSSWDPKIDFNDMIEGGVLIVEPADQGGFRVVLGNTTYSQDSNPVFNRISINEAANFVAFELRTHLESLFTGTKARTGSVSGIKNAAIDKLDQLRDADIIVDGNDPVTGKVIPAFRNLQVSIDGVTASLNVTITPVPGIDFELERIFLTSLQASTSA